MRRNALSIVVVIALLTTAALPLAGAQRSDQAQRREAIVDHLADGDVTQAQQVYNNTFRAPADAVPHARDAAEDGFAAARSADVDSTDYVVASQQIKKSLLAVAAANVDAAVADGDADAARAWFDVLHVKFGEELSDSKAAFDDATDQDVDEAHGVFLDEYRDLITAEVYHETAEVTGLIEGGYTKIAAKEAAEGRYYYASIEAHVPTVLGDQTGNTLAHELDELIDYAKAGNADEARTEAGEILDMLAHYALATAEDEKAEAYLEVKDHLGNEDVDAAETAYVEAFGEEGGEYAASADARVRQALDDARAALDAGDEVEYEVQSQLIAKGILDVGTRVAFAELREEEVDEGLEYFAPVVEKFGWADEPNEGALAVGHAAADNAVGDDRFEQIKAGVSAKFLDKVRAETDEVFINWDDPPTAREKAIEGVAYYHPARSYVVDILGEDPDRHLVQELRVLYNATTARDRAEAEDAADEVRTLLDQVASGGREVTEVDSLVNDLRGKVEFVLEEYRGYETAKADGNEDEAQVELGEAKAFTKGAKQKLKANRQMLDEIDEDSVDQVLANLDEISGILNETGSIDRVDALVTESVDLLVALKAGPVEETVTVAFGTPEPGDGGTAVVPVTLEGVPEDGFAFQAEVSYDASVVTVEGVEVLTQVGSSTTGDGTVTFNAAATEAPGGTATVAELTLAVDDPTAETVALDVTVQDLTDAQGEPLGVKSVEGDSVDLASVAGTGTLPGFAGVAALAALVVATLVFARTRRT